VEYSGPPRRSRNLDERLMVRFQSEYRRLAAFLWRRLSPRSRLRRAAYILDLGDRVLALGFYRGVIAL
jgi:hypothetical protein